MVMDKHQGQRMNYLQINIRTLRTKNKKKDIDREFVMPQVLKHIPVTKY